MDDKKNQGVRLERVMNHLAESVFEVSNEEVLAEIKAGTDPHDEAEHVRFTLRQVLKTLDTVQERLSSLGHRINPRHWWSDERAYHNNCLDCGSLVSFTITTNEVLGTAFDEPCAESQTYAVHRRCGNRKR